MCWYVRADSPQERAQRQELARQLGDMHHYDFVHHAAALVHDPLLQHLAVPPPTDGGRAEAKEPAVSSLASYDSDTPHLDQLVEKYTSSTVPALITHTLQYVFAKPPAPPTPSADAPVA